MTIEDFIEKLYGPRNKHYRLGQHMTNELFQCNQDLYRKMPRNIDPFYDNKKIDQFIEWLKRNWTEE